VDRERLNAALKELVKDWDEMAAEARQRAEKRQTDDIPPAYFLGIAFALETAAAQLHNTLAGPPPSENGAAMPKV
jgi:hypothetical protein